jgi:predicted ribosomally synthesized peptide with SipW-like signal peptide
MSIQNDGEYGSPITKTKVNKARKLIIGMMAVGTAVALGGAGTFASFSASTTNDGSFETARIALENDADGVCTSPSGVVGTGVENSALNTNDATGCQALFDEALVPGELYNNDVVLENVGNAAGDLLLFASDTCNEEVPAEATFDAGSSTYSICDRILITVDTPADGCIFPELATGACPTLDESADDTTLSFNAFDANTFNSALEVAAAADFDATDSVTANVKVYMLRTDGNDDADADTKDDCPVGITDAETAGAGNGFDDTTGIGCDNQYMNKRADLDLRWLIQA